MPHSSAGATAAGRAGLAGSGLPPSTVPRCLLPARHAAAAYTSTAPGFATLAGAAQALSSAHPPISWGLRRLPGAAEDRAQSPSDGQSNMKGASSGVGGCQWEGTARHREARLSGHRPLADDAEESAVPATPAAASAADNCPGWHSPNAHPSHGGRSRGQHRQLTDPGSLEQGWSRSAGSSCSFVGTALGFTTQTSSASAPSACAWTAAPVQLQHPVTSSRSSGGSWHCSPSEGSPGE